MSTTFTGTFAGALSTDSTLILGTCQLGDEFGQVKTGSLKRGADVKEIKNCKGGVRAVLLLNPKTVLSLKTVFDTEANLGQIGWPISLPLISVTGIITDVTVDWEEDGERGMTIEATGWDAVNGALTWQWTGEDYVAFYD